MAEKIPTMDNGLTADYLNSVLSNFKKIKQVDSKYPKTHGMMSNVRKLFLTYDNTDDGDISPSSIIAKYSRPAADNHCNQGGGDIMRHGELYKREVLMNQYLNGRDIVPMIYYTDCNDKQDIIILMEDCSIESDVKVGELNTIQKCMSVNDAFIAINDLAKFQSEFYHKNTQASHCGILSGNNDNFMKEKGLQWLPEYFSFVYYTTCHTEFVKSSNQAEFAKYDNEALKKLSESVNETWLDCCDYIVEEINFSAMEKYSKYDLTNKAKAIKEGTITVGEQWYNAYKALTEEAPLTITHCDFRFDNTLILNNHLKLVDWQCTSLGCGMIDVMSLLNNSLEIHDAVNNEDKFLESYFKVLQENGCAWVMLDDLTNWYSYALWYEFRNSLMFAKHMMGQGIKLTGISNDALQEIMLRKLAISIHGIYKYFYM